MISGETIIWCKRNQPNSYWTKLPHAPRSFTANEDLIDYYRTQWGAHYTYKITPNLSVCQPLA